MSETPQVTINQSVAILVDGNNIELSLHSLVGDSNAMLNFDTIIPKLLDNRALSRLIYFREGPSISSKLAERLHANYHGSVMPCYKSADIPLTIKATQIAQKVDTIIIMSGDADYVELVRHLRGEGVRVEIAAVKRTTAKILLDEADYFREVTEEDCFVFKTGKTTAPATKTKRTATKKSTTTRKKASTTATRKKRTTRSRTTKRATAAKKTTRTTAGRKRNAK